ncbi:MAG: hypothetical protein WD136_00995 [Cyanobium sp.]
MGLQKRHQETLEALYSHPIQRGLEVERVVELCRALGADVSHLDQNRLKLRWSGGEETWLHCGSGAGKQSLNAEALVRLRQALLQQGISLEHPEPLREASRGDQSHRLVIRMDRHHSDVFHLIGTEVEHAVLRPHGLWGSGQRLSHRHDRDVAGQRAPIDSDYLRRIEQAIASAEVVLLVGHGSGQSNLVELVLRHLSQHQPELMKRVEPINMDDTGLGDEELLALARRHFGNLPHRRTLRIPGQEVREA